MVILCMRHQTRPNAEIQHYCTVINQLQYPQLQDEITLLPFALQEFLGSLQNDDYIEQEALHKQGYCNVLNKEYASFNIFNHLQCVACTPMMSKQQANMRMSYITGYKQQQISVLYIEHQALTQYLEICFSLLHTNNGISHCGTVVHIP